ncbi:c-type cytochrome [Methylobacterium dankookense]|uniref:Cytochrome c4 n=1 Tax=Methylobacterium dankookense TaxID=560405 RepID=A0A564G5B1_9HYPH|nr:c-type cytochrome [Methylobacterium dankookense]GJD59646.1 Cytochrome c4 [Methylobacterium dankookense]VUF15138.1 Cytochrome c4 [Methylobacterium dankookense]
MRRPASGAVLALLLALQAAPAGAEGAAERLPACLACHGEGGTSAQAGVPSLGGMPADYVVTQLYLFREKQRVAEPMNAMAEGLSDDDLRALGDAVAKLPPPKPAGEADAARMAAAQGLVGKHQCNSCHGADLAGQEQIPRIGAQREDYLLATLRAYKSNARAGYDPAMNEVAQGLSDADIVELAYVIARR